MYERTGTGELENENCKQNKNFECIVMNRVIATEDCCSNEGIVTGTQSIS